MARVISLNVGKARQHAFDRTAIDKRPVEGPLHAGPLGLEGDEQADLEHHGGPYQAIYAYAREDLDWWQTQLGRDLPAGIFGENLTLTGLDVNNALLGERWRIGTTLLEVTSPRVPCGKFRDWLSLKGWVKTFAAAARPGAYLKVVTPGEITPGDPVELVHRPAHPHPVTITESFHAYHGDKPTLHRILATPHAPKWDQVAARVLR